MASVLGYRAAERQYWADRRGQDLSTDKLVSLIISSLLGAAVLYNISITYRAFEGGYVVSFWDPLGYMMVHVGLELVVYAYTQNSKLYAKHRAACIMFFRPLFLMMMLFYVPRTWFYTIPLELASGKHVALTWRMVIGGCLTVSNTVEILGFQLPMVLAVPYHTARALLCLLMALPQLLLVFADHQALCKVAQSIWEDISWLLGSAAMSAIGLDVPINRSSASCSVLALMLFAHVACALLIPLYILGVKECRSKKTYMARLHAQQVNRVTATNSSSSSIEARALEHWQQQQQRDIPVQQTAAGSAAAAAGSSSSAGSSSTMSNGGIGRSSGGIVAASAAAVAPTLASAAGAAESPFIISSSSSGQGSVWQAEFGVAVHVLIILCLTMLLWALVDVSVTLWAEKLITQWMGEARLCV